MIADHDARDRLRTQLDTTFLVEAGAGTGKTTALVGRIVELVAVDRLEMERLAAITFTEAAAAELRDRVRQELEWAAVRREHPGQRAACEAAARQVDLASIQTIHAFAGSLLQTFPLEAHLPPRFAMLDEIRQARAFDDRFRAWLYDEVPNPDMPQRRAAVRRVLALGMSPEQLRLLATRLEDYRDLLDARTTWEAPALRDPIEVAHRWAGELLEQALFMKDALNPRDRLVAELRRLQPTAERLASVDEDDEALRLLRQCDPHLVGLATNWPPGRCAAIKRVMREAAADIDAFIAEHRSAALAGLLRYLRDFTLAGATQRRAVGEATFHDLLTWARDLLRDHPDVRRRAQARYDRIFVDEFQDTDPLQVELAWFLASDPAQSEERTWTSLRLVPGKLFIVGDPKQSIYRFRRADIGIYQQVYELLERAAAREVLSQSFRSPAPVLDWVNDHFTSDMQFLPRAQPAYAPLAPRPAVSGADARTLRCGVWRMGERIDAAGQRWLAEADAVARAAHHIVRGDPPWWISERRGEPPIRQARFSDVCVLIPSRSNLRRLERAFQLHGVPYRMESGWLVLHTQEVRDLLSCLRAIDDPSDQVALVAALRSPAFGCSDVDLLQWIEAGGRLDYERPREEGESAVRAALASLRAFHDARLNHSPAQLIELVIRERMLAVQAFGTPQPRDALRRLRYVVAQARTLAASGATTLRELCDWLETRQSELYYDAESAVPDADEDAVRFLTVHGAKGLEFPIVILTGLSVATSRMGPQSVDLVPNYAPGVLDIRCGDFATVGYARETEKAMYEAEQKRLLYVATTRARDHLVLSLYHGKDDSHATRIVKHLDGRPGLVQELELDAVGGRVRVSRDAPAPSRDEAASGASADKHRADEAALLDRRQQVIDQHAHQTVVAPSALSHLPEAESADPPPEPDPNTSVRRLRKGRGGSALGRAVHAVLQVIDLASLAHLEELARSAAHDEHIPEAAPTVMRFVRHAARSQPIQAALSSGRYWREVPVGVVRDDGAIVEGAIDLLHEQPDGSLVIVDYKSDSVSADQVAARAAAYRPQGEAYAACLTRATGRAVARVAFVFAALDGQVSSFGVS